MKRLLFIALLSALLTACKNDDDQVDMAAFLDAARNGVWLTDETTLFYTDGQMVRGHEIDGGSLIDPMVLLPDGECRIFLRLDFRPLPTLYQSITWNVSASQPNTIELYSRRLEQDPTTYRYNQYAVRTTLKLTYYKNGTFIMKGMQPFASSSSKLAQGIYKDYCIIRGHIATDKETVEKYLSYEEYETYRAQHPEMFP